MGGLFSGIGKSAGSIVKRSTGVNGENFDYQLYLPQEVKSKAKLPLIIFLHGIRERGRGGYISTEGTMGKVLLQYLKQVSAIVLLPQCRPGKYWIDAEMDKMVMQSLARSVEEFGADTSRIYLIGVSMGGYGVWHFASHYPKKFAALVSICGGSPVMQGERYVSVARKIGNTPAWLFHGAEDNIVPVSESREMAKALKENHGEVKYNEYPNVGHNVWFNALAEKQLLPWLLSQSLKDS